MEIDYNATQTGVPLTVEVSSPRQKQIEWLAGSSLVYDMTGRQADFQEYPND